MGQVQYNTDPGVNLEDVGLNSLGRVVSGEKLTAGAPTTLVPNYFEVGCVISNRTDGALYVNTGTLTTPIWTPLTGTAIGETAGVFDDASWVTADTVNDRAAHHSTAIGTANHSHWFTFTYEVI